MGFHSPVRPEEGLLRLRKEFGTYDNLRPCGLAIDTGPYSRAEIERIARLGGFLAMARYPPAEVWSLDKADVLATSRLWRKTVNDVFKEGVPAGGAGPSVDRHCGYVDGEEPEAVNGVIITSNLFGEIIRDEASVISGSIGLLPSASLGGIPDRKSKCNGIYEPIHGKSSGKQGGIRA